MDISIKLAAQSEKYERHSVWVRSDERIAIGVLILYNRFYAHLNTFIALLV